LLFHPRTHTHRHTAQNHPSLTTHLVLLPLADNNAQPQAVFQCANLLRHHMHTVNLNASHHACDLHGVFGIQRTTLLSCSLDSQKVSILMTSISTPAIMCDLHSVFGTKRPCCGAAVATLTCSLIIHSCVVLMRQLSSNIMQTRQAASLQVHISSKGEALHRFPQSQTKRYTRYDSTDYQVKIFQAILFFALLPIVANKLQCHHQCQASAGSER